MSTISASTTSTTAFKITTDTTGALVFQTGASPTTAMTLGSDQSVTFAGTPTYSGGTANGVAYLNASKVLTTGTALTFDGTALASTGSGTQSFTVTSSATAAYVQTTGAGAVNARLQSNSTTAQVGTLSNHNFVVQTNGNNVATFDTSGNLGVGVTPSAWETGRKVVQVGTAAIDTNVVGQAVLRANNYYNGTNNKYIFTGYASAYEQYDGAHRWYTAASGTAGNNLSFTQSMILDTSGRVGIGETAPASTLVVRKDASGGRGGELSIVNYAATALNSSAALNFGLEASTYAGDDGNVQIKALLTNTGNAASDTVYSNWNGSTFIENMRVDSAGRRTNPYQSYAYVRFNWTSTAGSWTKATGSSAVVNTGSNWDTGNNKFTAPIAGRYLVFLGGYSTTAGTASERYGMGVYKNGTLLQFCGGNLSAVDTPLAGAPFVFDLAANDYLELWMFTAVAMSMTSTTNHSLYMQVYLVG